MTFAPVSLRELGVYWARQGGVNLGIVGDANHRTGYHLGRDRIYDGAGPGRGDDDYSVRHPRDKAGLSDAASAIDLGKLGESYNDLYAFSRWLVSTAPVGGDIREIIYSPDGNDVQRWSGIDGKIYSGEGNGDASHRTHTHISFFRDSEERSKVPLFEGYFGKGDMAINVPQSLTSAYRIDIPANTAFYSDADCSKRLGTVEAERLGDRALVYVGAPLGEDVAGGSRAVIFSTAAPYADKVRRPTLVYFKGSEVGTPERRETEPPPPPDTSPSVLTGDDGSEYRRV